MMKFKVFDRILLTIYAIVILVSSLLLLAISLSLRAIHLNNVMNILLTIQTNWYFTLVAIILSLILIAMSLRLLFSLRSSKKPTSTLLKTTELGSIHVSLNTLDYLTQRAVRSFEAVRDIKSVIIPDTDGVRVLLKMSLLPDNKMPELTSNIQVKVKEYVEDLSGISVKQVQIFIDQLSSGNKAH